MTKITPSSKYPNTFGVVPDAVRPIITEIVLFNYSEIATEHYGPLHLHHYHQLDVVLEGEVTLTLKDQPKCVGHAGDAWIIPPLIWHGLDCSKPFRWCSFKFHMAPHLWPALGKTFAQFTLPKDVQHYVKRVGEHSSQMTLFSGERTATAISLCLFELLEQKTNISTQDDAWDEFRQALWLLLEKIQRDPSIRWTVKRMADKLGLSPDYFTRCFRGIVKQTPRQYVLETAMRSAAANLLKIPAISIKEIAQRAGYANVQAFTHAFTRVFKVSPGYYRSEMV